MRYSAQFVKEKYKDNAIVVSELGVHLGLNALDMITNMNISKMYLVDDYNTEKEIIGYTQSVARYREAYKNLEPYKGICEWFVTSTHIAYKYIPDESIDYVYIDAAHDYESVKQDLHLWWSKVKKGGVFAGHDYKEPLQPGVEQAVNEFIQREGLELNVMGVDWWVIK